MNGHHSWGDLWRLKTAVGDGLLVFSDLRTASFAWQLEQVPCDGRGEAFVHGLHDSLKKVLLALPEEDPPWVLQWFLADESHLNLAGSDFCSASDDMAKSWRELLESHLERCSDGVFRELGQRSIWRSRRRCVRLLMYRAPGQSAGDDEAMLDACSRVEEALAVAGIKAHALGGEQMLNWLGSWLTGDVQLSAKSAFGGPDMAAIDACFAGSHHCDLPLRALADNRVCSDAGKGIWTIGERLHRFLPLSHLSAHPSPGALTAELQHPDGVRAFWDQMPPGAVFSLCSVHFPAGRLRKRLMQVAQRARGSGAEAAAKRDACHGGLSALARGERIGRVSGGLYLQAGSEEQLEEYSRHALAVFAAAGWQLTAPRQDHFHLDSWCRNLPGNVDPADEHRWYRRRSVLWYDEDLAAVLPLYGRSRGTGTAGVLFFNRGGEPLICDPLSGGDRVRNAHSLIVGPTGSGKTALLIYLLLSMAARHRPRMFLVTTLPTFDLLGDWLEKVGWTLHRVRLKASGSQPIPPFAGAMEALTTERGSDSTEGAAGRDRISELELIASLMVASDSGKLQHWQSDWLREAVMRSASELQKDPMVSDVVDMLRQMSRDRSIPDAHRQVMLEMAGAMNRYTRGIAGAIFDRPGALWPDADCTILDLGIAGRKGYEHLRTLAYITFIQRINNLIEGSAGEKRQTLVVTDEAHVILGEPQLAAYLSAITAQWRTWGAWKWVVTQSLRQIPESSRGVLNMMEWWWCLGLDRDEVSAVSGFRGLMEEQKNLLADTRKEPGKYVEGVVISDRLQSRFRAVLPPLALALSQTEKAERAVRLKLAEDEGCTELQAALKIADQMEQKEA